MLLQPLPLRGFDEECRKFIAEQYEVHGLNIHSQSTPTKIEKKDDGSLSLHIKHSDKEEVIDGLEVILMATGRNPNTQNIGLEKVHHSALSWFVLLCKCWCCASSGHAQPSVGTVLPSFVLIVFITDAQTPALCEDALTARHQPNVTLECSL